MQLVEFACFISRDKKAQNAAGHLESYSNAEMKWTQKERVHSFLSNKIGNMHIQSNLYTVCTYSVWHFQMTHQLWLIEILLIIFFSHWNDKLVRCSCWKVLFWCARFYLSLAVRRMTLEILILNLDFAGHWSRDLLSRPMRNFQSQNQNT